MVMRMMMMRRRRIMVMMIMMMVRIAGMHGAAFFCFGAGRGRAEDIFFGAWQGSKFTGRGIFGSNPPGAGHFRGRAKRP